MGNFFSSDLSSLGENVNRLSRIPHIHCPIIVSLTLMTLSMLNTNENNIDKVINVNDSITTFFKTLKEDSEYITISFVILINEILNTNILENTKHLLEQFNCKIIKCNENELTKYNLKPQKNINTIVLSTLIFTPKWGSIINIVSVKNYIITMAPTLLHYYSNNNIKGIALPFEGGFTLYIINDLTTSIDKFVPKIKKEDKQLIEVKLPMWTTNFDITKFDINDHIDKIFYKQSASFVNLDRNDNIKLTNVQCRAKLDITGKVSVNNFYIKPCHLKFHYIKNFQYAICNYDDIIIFNGIIS